MRLSGKMRSSLVIFCVSLCLSVDASEPNNCSSVPVELNAEVTESSRKNDYLPNDKLYFQCFHGYSSRRRISYICKDNKWTKQHNEKCELKRCELPEDIPNGQYSIVNGSSFVFGTTIKYTCKEGYQLMSRHNSRTCRDGGWDNRAPVCEESSCVPERTETNLNVEGLPDFDEIIRYGHRLTFSCNGRGLMLNHTNEITCMSNGQWSHPFPKCVEATCHLNITAQYLKTEPDIEGPVKFDKEISFSCTHGMKLNGPQTVICLENGKWSKDFPKCEEPKCVKKIPVNMRSDANEDEKTGSEISVKPGRTITFSCARSGSTLQGQKEIRCGNDGQWQVKISDLPKCTEGKCGPPPPVNNADTEKMTDKEYNSGEHVIYKCFDKYILDERPPKSDNKTCQDGEWKGDIYCLEPCTVTEEIMNERGLKPRWNNDKKMFCKHDEFVEFACKDKGKSKGKMTGIARIQCNDGKITLPKCV